MMNNYIIEVDLVYYVCNEALTNGISTVDALVAVLCTNSIGMAPVYHWQLWEPATPKDWQCQSEDGMHQELHKLYITARAD